MGAGRVVAAVIAGAVLVQALWRRRSLTRRAITAWIVAAVLLAVYAAGVLPDPPDLEAVLAGIATTLGPYTYVLVGSVAFLETGAFLGFLTPGDFAVLIGGMVAARGEVDIVLLIGLVWACSLAGDATGYLVGRRLGRAFLVRHGPRMRITEERLLRVEGFFARRGGAALLVGRFVAIVRPLTPFIAGSSRMPFGRFLPYSVIGTGLWATTFSLLGYVFYRSFSQVAGYAGQATLGLGITVVVGGLGLYAYRRLRSAEERAALAEWLSKQGRRPALRPLAATLGPAWRRVGLPAGRFARGPLRAYARRLVPTHRVVELTTAVAVAGAGLFVFGAYARIFVIFPGALTPLDRAFTEVLGALRTGATVAPAAVLTALASLSVTAGLTLLGTAWLIARRRYADAVTLVSGAALVWLSVELTRALVERPAPLGAVVEVERSSFPSSHAAYAMTLVALAVVARRTSSVLGRAALLGLGLGMAATVGLGRIFLGADHFSDVAAGWGLGAGVYATCAVVAILAVHLIWPRRGTGAPAGWGVRVGAGRD